MNCSDFEMNVLALVRPELIDASRRDAILGHSEECLRCADRLAGEQALLASVKAVVAEVAEQKAPAHVRNALLAAFREHTLAPDVNNIVTMPLKVERSWRLEAVAAAILFLASMGAIYWIYSRQDHVAMTVPPATVSIEAPAPVKNDGQLPGNQVTAPPSKSPHRARRHHRATEQVTEFFPLMEGIDIDSLEAVQAVRVELPESALNDLGLPTGVQTPHGPIRADVLLGIDGVARAIRFVR